jgi:hypothetical protein
MPSSKSSNGFTTVAATTATTAITTIDRAAPPEHRNVRRFVHNACG